MITEEQASLDVQGIAAFDGDHGNDEMTLVSIFKGESLLLDAVDGNDRIVLGNLDEYLVSVGGRLTIAGGRGESVIDMLGTDVEISIQMMTDIGSDG